MHGLKRYLPRLDRRTPAFLVRLATHLEAGFPARQALELSRPPVAAPLVEGARRTLDAGGTLAEVLASLGRLETGELRVFEAAEAAGRLPAALERCAEERDAERERTASLVGRLVYPLSLLHLAPVALCSSDLFIRGRLAASAGFVLAWWATLWGVLLLARVLFADAERRPALSRAALSLPLLGPTLRARAIAAYFRVLEGLYGAGIPLLEAHRRATACVPHPHVRTSLEGSLERAGGTATLGELLSLSGTLRGEELHLIETGERSGRLEETFGRLARLCSEEAIARAAGLVRLIGAVLYAVAVIAVALTVFSFWSSYFDGLRSLR